MRTPKELVTDMELEDAVLAELGWDPSVDGTGVDVGARNGAVTLTGHVPSYRDKDAAVRAVERVRGVRAVADDLEVALPKHTVRRDSELAAAIAQARSATGRIPDTVGVEVSKGYVTLRGTVRRSHERQDAIRAIRDLEGIRGIADRIEVVPLVAASPEEVERRIAEELARMADLDAASISVEAHEGAVRLRGEVHSLAERRLVERAAASAPGVISVDNDRFVAR